MNFMPLKILNLPYTAQKIAILNMEPNEILDLSFVSKQSKSTIKQVMPEDEVKVEAYFMKDPKVSIDFGKKSTVQMYENAAKELINEHWKDRLPLEECTAKSDWDKLEKEKMVWVKTWADYICDVFNCNVHTLNIHWRTMEDKIFNWLYSRQNSIEDVYYEGNLNQKKVEYFIKNVKINGVCHIETSCELKLELKKVLKMRVFDVDAKYKLTLDGLSKIDCPVIMLGKLNITAKQVNRFLKDWINGANKKLEFFSATVRKLDHQLLKKGIEVEERKYGTYYFDHHRNMRQYLERGTDIRRRDGKSATFGQIFNMTTVKFVFIVWPEEEEEENEEDEDEEEDEEEEENEEENKEDN